MYPWKDAFDSWTESTQLQIDALGLITIIGADEVNVSVGRLVPNRYAEFLPLLGAFILASNRFTKNQSNFELYNLTEGIKTTEVAGWLSRWLKAQDFHQVHHKIRWDVQRSRLPGLSYIWTALAISIPCHGMLLALTVLSADWWGFLNVLAMILSVVVRVTLVHQNRAGIDKAIDAHRSATGEMPAKLLLIMDDSKVVTMEIPCHLVKAVFIKAPTVPNNHLYRFTRWVGWTAFAAHIISIGMASLPTQICTVFLIVASTILTTFKVGCDDWRMEAHIAQDMGKTGEQAPEGVPCRISSSLTAVCSEYPKRYDEWVQRFSQLGSEDPPGRQCGPEKAPSPTERRRDLFIWLDLTDDELDSMKMWNLVPQTKNTEWWGNFNAMRERWRDSAISIKITTG
ncbi:hypothetical protein CKAH01_16762 [Colletotrichum kahawae]|uniref:Uncharacterized protein n=1 Tax=Colletotrichum kahawae TaxID=34407 RepID=A0AAD9YGD9_COLKA|nr:hypothetical protein CKAH01_16762 [Colletotrichum kahawae]